MNPLETGAKAWFDRVQAQRLDAGRKRPDGRAWQWDDLTESDRVGYRALVRPVVESAEAERDAARAEAWQEGYVRGTVDMMGDLDPADNPYLAGLEGREAGE